MKTYVLDAACALAYVLTRLFKCLTHLQVSGKNCGEAGLMKERFNILLSGVGGQGLITLGRLIGRACIIAGVNVTIAEVHGMSQRGGSVVVHVRIGDGESPIIPIGSAHHIIAMEILEAGRSARYANKDTVMVVNDLILPPPLVKYPTRENVIESLRSKIRKFYLYNAEELSKKIIGTGISSNIALLGFSMSVNPLLEELIERADVERAIDEMFKGKSAELNKEILEKSYEAGRNRLGG